MKLDMPERRFGAYIFDCDGTLADTMPLHYVAWKRIVGEHGGNFSEELFYAMGGRPTRQIVELLRDEHGERHLKRPASARRFARIQIGFDHVGGVSVIEVHEVIAHRDGG